MNNKAVLTDLEACPFCGQDGEVLRTTVVQHYKNGEPVGSSVRVRCTGCGATAPLTNWNTRIRTVATTPQQ